MMGNIFVKFDNYLKSLPKTQLYMLYFLVSLLGSYISYNTIPNMMDERDMLQQNISNLQKSIKLNSIARLERALKNDRRVYLVQKEKLDKQKEQLSLLMSKLYSLEFAIFDEREWVKTLDKILKRSVDYNLAIEYIKNSTPKKTSSEDLVKKKKSVEILGVGKYADIIKYIHYIESLNALIKFDDIKLGLAKDKTSFKLDFTVYGVGL